MTREKILVKKFDMFYYYVCTTQYITDTKQRKKRRKRSRFKFNCSLILNWLFLIADIGNLAITAIKSDG